MPTKEPWVTLSVDDGTAMRAFVANPAGRARGGILVFQEAYGVNAHIRDVATRFAKQGLLAIAPELYHRTATGFEGVYDDFASVQPHFQKMTTEGLAADARAAYTWLAEVANADRDNIVASGYCMGGRVSFIANSELPLRAAVSYYGGGIAPALLDRVGRLHGPQLFFWGGKDTHIPPEVHRPIADAMRAAGKPFIDVEFSEAGHGFFCDARPAYNPKAAKESWALTLSFLGMQSA